MNAQLLKRLLPHAGVLLLFYILSVGYFTPRIFEGKTLFQVDTRKGAAMAREANQYAEKTGERTLWTNSAFSGMPTYQITPSYQAKVIQKVRRAMEGWLPDPASYLFLYLTGFYILLLTLRLNPWMAAAGAVAYAFSTYFISIIQAGHIWKVLVLGLIPPTFAGIILTFRKKYLLGGIITALFLALQIYNNHIQVSYYFFALLVSLYGISQAIEAHKSAQWPAFLKSSGVLLAAVIIAMGVNITNLYTTATYTKFTTRGKPLLSANKANQTSGLDRDYVTQWSYGVGETFSLLVPNIRGGGNGALGDSPSAMEKVSAPMKEQIAQSDRYWGNQPGLSAPSYVGALILFLALLGVFLLKGSFKWVLAGASVWSVMLAWGKNFMPLTNLFLDYFPLYNKFRAPSMAMVVAEIAIPVLALLMVRHIAQNPGIIAREKRKIAIAFGLTGGLSFLFWLIPDLFFSFLSQAEVSGLADLQAKNPQSAGAIGQYVADLTSARKSLLQADALRSFLFISAGMGALWFFSKAKMGVKGLTLSIFLLVLVDLWSVDKRYLNTEMSDPYGNKQWVSKREKEAVWPMTEADKTILQDTTPHFRVMNLAVSTFSDGSTSWWHKSIGGYHGAKLGRYQDLVDHQIAKGNQDVLNMLNTKYLILPGALQQPQARLNPDALGNGWFVQEVLYVETPDEEMAALTDFDPAQKAIVGSEFKSLLNGALSYQKDSAAYIRLTEYSPNRLTYATSNRNNGLALFSEVWYPDGWDAYVDGKKTDYLRANYLLRALPLPAGNHTLEFRFEPKAYAVCEKVSMGFVLLLFAGLALLPYMGWKALVSPIAEPEEEESGNHQ